MYTVIGTPRGRALRVMWMLEELGEHYDHFADPPPGPEFAPVDPGGRPSPLVVDGTQIRESTAAIQYLADRHGRFTHPAGTLERARQDDLTQFLLDEFDAALWLPARHSYLLPAALRVGAASDSLKAEFSRSQAKLMVRMSGAPFLAGAEMTVPDLICAHCGLWADVAGFGVTEPWLEAYFERMTARPAFRRASAR